jgi:hypothetical protein
MPSAFVSFDRAIAHPLLFDSTMAIWKAGAHDAHLSHAEVVGHAVEFDYHSLVVIKSKACFPTRGEARQTDFDLERGPC